MCWVIMTLVQNKEVHDFLRKQIDSPPGVHVDLRNGTRSYSSNQSGHGFISKTKIAY